MDSALQMTDIDGVFSPNSTEAKRRRLKVLLAMLLALTSALPFLPALDGTWIYDDIWLIRDNRSIRSLEAPLRWFSEELFDAPISQVQLQGRKAFYRPLVVMSYAIDHAIFGGSPIVFHVTNLLLHAGATALAFFAAHRWLGRLWPAFWAALFFSVHPTKAESVAWISGRPDPMFSFFLLLALLSHARAMRSGSGRLGWLLVFIVSSTLSLLSKETAVLLPVFVAVETYSKLGCPRLNRATLWTLFEHMGPALALVATYAVLRIAFLPALIHGEQWGGLVHRLLFFLQTSGHLLELLVFPQDLSMLGTGLRTSGGALQFSTLYCTAGLGAVLISVLLGVRLYRNRALPASRRALTLLLLTIVALGPVLQLVPTGLNVMTQPRFWYLPLLPAAALFFHIISKRRQLVVILGLLTVVPLFSLSVWRSRHFASSDTFWAYELKRNPATPSVIQTRLSRDLVLGGTQLAARRAICGFDQAQRNYGAVGADKFLAAGLDYALARVPDGAPELYRAAEFIARVRQGQPARFDGFFSVSVVPNSPVARAIRDQAPPWVLREGALRARFGQPEAAKALLAEAVRTCSRCDDISFGAAKVAVLMGDLELALRYAKPLGERARHTLRSVAHLVAMSEQDPGPRSAFQLAGAGRLLEDNSISLRAILPYANQIEQSRHEETMMTLALISGQAGELERALSIYRRLSPQGQERMDALGFPEPIEDRNEPFVDQTCALPSEL